MAVSEKMGKGREHYHPQTEFRIEPPSGRSKSFRIRFNSPATQGKWVPINLPEIDIANDHFKSGLVSKEHTKEKLKLILQGLYAERDKVKKKPEFQSKNIELVKKLWEEKYTRRRLKTLKRPNESYNDYMRAAEAVGMMPLDTCNLEDLEDHLHDTLGEKPTILRRRIIWINSILMWLGRPKIPQLKRMPRKSVRYLTEDEFFQVYTHLNGHPWDRTLAKIAFYTGMRVGEIFGLYSKDVLKNQALVVNQMKAKRENHKDDTTKTDSERRVIILDEVAEDLKNWVQVSNEERVKIRDRHYADVISNACLKAFPKDEQKHLNFRDLRHCCAIYMLQNGIPIHLVAQQLGNAVEVTERFYSGFILKEESIEFMQMLISKAKEKKISEDSNR
jgi:integrase